MSNFSDEGKRGAYIIPSARKPIHTRYSDKMSNKKKSTQEQSLSNQDQGEDEVDNVSSEPDHPLRSISHSNIPSGRDVEEDSLDASVNEEKLSSSPPRPPSSISQNNAKDVKSCDYRKSYENINKLSYQLSKESRRASSASSLHYPQLEAEKPNYASYMTTVTIAVAAAVVLLIAMLYNSYSQQAITTSSYDRFSFNNDIQKIGLQYKIKDDSLLQVTTGINTIFEKQDTGSFIFTYDSSMPGFNTDRFNKFMHNVAWAASKYLRNNTKDVQHVVLDNSKIISLKSDYELIENFRHVVDNRGVLLVKNIEQIPSKFAMAFHYYCDEFNPLVKKSAVFFTFNVAECSSSSSLKASHAFIEKCLQAKWKEVQGDKIGPLLNRVVNIVVDVMSV